jgi:hypothetical protein
MLALSLTPDLVADIRRCYREFQREPQLIQVMTNFYQEIDELISSNTSPQ